MRRDYRCWLKKQGYGDGTIAAQIHRVGRVEDHYGDLDSNFERDGLSSLLEALTYSTEDQRQGRPNPTRIPFNGHVRNNLASYKSAVLWYRRFRQTGEGELNDRSSWTSATSSAEQSLTHRPAADAAAASTATINRSPRDGARTLADFRLDGRAALEAIIAASQYRTVAQAVASLTLFSHPRTVQQTSGRAVFPSIRNQKRVGQIDLHGSRRVLLDDNKSPKDAFLWANGLSRRGPDTQFNHVYTASADVEAYTALPNICMTPAFIAKLTDTSEEVRQLLRYRSFQLYGWFPAGYPEPPRPEEYETLEWATPLPAVDDVRAAITRAMATKPKDRTVVAARSLGWLFAEPSSSEAIDIPRGASLQSNVQL